MKIRKINLGNQGLVIPEMGLGCMTMTTFSGQDVYGSKANEAEAISEYAFSILHTKKEVVLISAKERKGLDELQQRIIAVSGAGALDRGDLLVTNTRHVEALQRTREFLEKTLSGLEQQIPGDLLAMDLRQALYHLGEITGQVTADDLLGNIFSRFCIGK
jgi:tRNA modification GTPase